jgi:glycosyl transferase family 87
MTVRQVVTRRRLRSAVLPAACWLWTRGVLLLFTYKVVPYISQSDITGDVKLYNKWSLIFTQGRFPHDPQWQYPPGTALVMTLPRLLRSLTGISYYSAFYLLALTSDLIIFLLVLYACWQTAARREAALSGVAVSGGTVHVQLGPPVTAAAPVRVRPDYTGLWTYTVAIFMIGPIVLGRYDIMVTMAATVGLVATGRTAATTWRTRGAALGFGTVLKLWPAAIAVGLPKRADGRRALRWAVLGAGIPALALAALLPGAIGFLSGQQNRGLEIESIPATPFLIARHFGYPGRIRHEYGAFEITGPGVSIAATLSLLLTAAGFVWLLGWWRRRANLVPARWTTALYYDAGLVAVLIAVVTSRVLSPQYLVWLVGLIALCLTLAPNDADGIVSSSGAAARAGVGAVLESDAVSSVGPVVEGRSVLAGPCWLLLAAISVTQIDFPLLFPRLVHDGRWAAWFLAGRNLLLVTAMLWGAYALWRAVAPAPRPAARGASAATAAEARSRVAESQQQPAGQ